MMEKTAVLAAMAIAEVMTAISRNPRLRLSIRRAYFKSIHIRHGLLASV
jgi:hypothetical protein